MANIKYGDLSVFSFGNRTKEDQAMAVKRVTVPESSPELKAINKTIEVGESPFSIDCTLITQDPYYRRLNTMGQLAPSTSPHFQNRASHTEHVDRIAVRICNFLKLDKDSTFLTKAIVSAHDIGHAPFSHTSESLFNDKLKLWGASWDHDYFGLSMVTEYANRGTGYKGLPITAGTIEGFAKRYKKYNDEGKNDYFNRDINSLGNTINEIEKKHKCLHLKQWNCIEGQIASTSDWIAFTVSDIKDILLITLNKAAGKNLLPSEIREKMQDAFTGIAESFPPAKALWERMEQEIKDTYKVKHKIEEQDHISRTASIVSKFCYELENTLIMNVLDNSVKNYQENKDKIETASDIRKLDSLLVTPDKEMRSHLIRFDGYLKSKIYPQINQEYIDTYSLMNKFYDIVEDGFKNPESNFKINHAWKDQYNKIKSSDLEENKKEAELVKTIASYIALNCSERDVIYFVKKLNPEYAQTNIGNYERIYPVHMPPSPAISTLQEVTRIMNERHNSDISK